MTTKNIEHSGLLEMVIWNTSDVGQDIRPPVSLLLKSESFKTNNVALSKLPGQYSCTSNNELTLETRLALN